MAMLEGHAKKYALQSKGIQTNMSTGDRLLDAMAMQEGTDEPQEALMGDDTDNGGTELNVQQVHAAWESAVAQAAMETYEAGCLKASDFLWKPMEVVENVESYDVGCLNTLPFQEFLEPLRRDLSLQLESIDA